MTEYEMARLRLQAYEIVCRYKLSVPGEKVSIPKVAEALTEWAITGDTEKDHDVS